jgi:hypothetical protein
MFVGSQDMQSLPVLPSVEHRKPICTVPSHASPMAGSQPTPVIGLHVVGNPPELVDALEDSEPDDIVPDDMVPDDIVPV